jgi:hypothetical protein
MSQATTTRQPRHRAKHAYARMRLDKCARGVISHVSMSITLTRHFNLGSRDIAVRHIHLLCD